MQSRRALTDHEKRVVAYHEAGHALCGELLPSVDRVHRISIVPRGRALGYTLNLPEEDRYLKTREELIDFMTMLLGGRAAEQLVFGSITTGASDDLKRVAEIAHAMIEEYAMGTGSSSLRVHGDSAAEATRRVNDTEIRELADEGFRDSLGMPLVHRETVVEQGVEAALLDVGDGHVELLQPLGPDTAVGKFLAKRGPGLHHVAYRVEDVEQTLTELAGAGMRLIDERPRTGIRGSRVGFVHPASTGR